MFPRYINGFVKQGTETKDQREEEQEMRRKDMLGRSAREMMVSERNFIESLEIVAVSLFESSALHFQKSYKRKSLFHIELYYVPSTNLVDIVHQLL